jgi:hypothetical protein
MEEPKDNDEYKKTAMTADEKKKDKYGDDVGKFNISDCSKIKNGPVMERNPTDFFCLLVFLAFFGTMIAATIYGFKKGDVEKYIAPLDGNDNFCGIDAGYEDYPKLYLPKLLGSPTDIFNEGMCVKECPQSTTSSIVCADSSPSYYYCNSDNAGTYPGGPYKTNTVMGYCMPDMDTLETDRP